MSVWPSVEVLIPTHNRPVMLAEAIAAVQSQEYAGGISICVIFDRQKPDPALADDDSHVPVRVIENFRSPGLSGARNSGILTSTADYVAFCDDDDVWLPGKLQTQVERLHSQPSALFVTTSIRVDFGRNRSPRYAGMTEVPHSRLLESRMAMLHSSTFLVNRERMLNELGLVSEDAPGSQNEDWELLLRASRYEAITHVDEPLVAVRWGSTSMFSRAWESKILSSEWILSLYPEIRESRVGYARLLAQMAFAHAALGDFRQAIKNCWRAARARPLEPRTYLAGLVALRVVPPRLVLEALHRRGHGI